MAISPLAGRKAPASLIINVDQLVNDYLTRKPDMGDPRQRVSFGTSGHRGTSTDGSFTAAHIYAITQAICDYRRSKNITGPLYLGKDTHALSGPAQQTALEVLAANGIDAIIQSGDGPTPTPVISHAILVYNRDRKEGLADGIVITKCCKRTTPASAESPTKRPSSRRRRARPTSSDPTSKTSATSSIWMRSNLRS
jgi:phosphoglucomutase